VREIDGDFKRRQVSNFLTRPFGSLQTLATVVPIGQSLSERTSQPSFALGAKSFDVK